MEFPPTCEVRVNGTALQVNLKGLKKKPGTAPPADLGRMVRMNGQNRIEMVYVNSQQPVQPKVSSLQKARSPADMPKEILHDSIPCRSDHSCATGR